MSDRTPPSPADRSVKIPHLVFALLFLGVAGIWALTVTDVITEDRLPILAPAVLIVAGVIGLAASLASSRNRRTRTSLQEGHLHHYDSEQYDAQPSDQPGDQDGGRHDDSAEHELDDHTQEIR